jgi:hydrogenase-4 component B
MMAGASLGLLAGMAAFKAPRLSTTATLFGAAMALAAAAQVLIGGGAWEWQPGFAVCGEQVHLRLDALSALFLALLSLVGGAGAAYALEYWNDTVHPHSAGVGRLWWNLLMLCLGIVLVTLNGLHFLIAWELFTISAYFLVTSDRQAKEVRAAGWLYLTASHVAALCLFAFFATCAARTGSWELGDMRGHADLAPLFWLALAGFGLKAGIFPLHVWLPSAHANAPSHVSAMLSGMTLKIGIYGLVRFSGWIVMPASAGWLLAALGVTSAVLGVVFALGQHDFKRLLAYHSVENIGIILIGLGFAMVAARQGNAVWGQLALAGALLHVWNHGLFKSLLFFGAGSVLHATGTREMSRLGGLWRLMPWTTSLFALGAVAISGLPPLNGFVSEWLIYLGLLDATIAHGPAAWAAIPAAILLGVTGALALACFVKACGVIFLGAPRSEAALRAHECGPSMRGAMLMLAAGCVAIGLAPAVFWPAISRAVEVWQPVWAGVVTPAPLASLGAASVVLAVAGVVAALWLWSKTRRNGLKRAVTWDCGYAAPTARMQYTAASFAATIVEWFDWILRPVKHEQRAEAAFPDHASLTQHTPETVLEYAVEPAVGGVMRLSLATRRLQHGRVQTYLIYLLIAIAALAALVLAGGDT